MSDPLQCILTHRVVAIVRLDDLTQSSRLVRALLDGGLRAIEFTLTNRDALAVTSRLRQEFAEFSDGTACLGIGSVKSVADASAAIQAGAQFLVTPIVSTAVIEASLQRATPVVSGAMTPTEIHQAWTSGASIVKVFPARGLGPGYIRDVLAPMPEVRLMPTGGVDTSNLAAYLRAGAVAVGVGGKLVDAVAVRAGRWSDIRYAAEELVARAKECCV
ncbi:MAG: bifunctional 4-hydroxy-2-oxoglutarate aldolase/2-dehydro-3-deoxy-phosphogluconate aldolase [Planctomycetota bacterium]|nr:MAG: bifunctional 4-hydroxy-2-oxoglutarate aldolase/2-dehydro-3-deoxy-phosphogluconate aldolase [Planctomycetota bacterium]